LITVRWAPSSNFVGIRKGTKHIGKGNFRVKLAIFLVAGFFYAGCASSGPPIVGSAAGPTFNPASRQEGKGVLYLYRPFRFGSGGAAPFISVDDKKIVLLKNQGYTWIYLNPGNHIIETRYSSAWMYGKTESHGLLTESNEVYYMRVKAKTGFGFVVGIIPFGLTSNFGLLLIKESEALNEIRETRYLKPKITYLP